MIKDEISVELFTLSAVLFCSPKYALKTSIDFKMVNSVFLQSAGTLSLFGGLLALKMSFFRLAGSPGEQDPESPLNKWWLSQTLAAEWNPLCIGLFLAMHVKGDDSDVAKYSAILLTFARLVFGVRHLFPKSLYFPIGFPSMVTSYAAVFVLSSKLLLDW